MRGVAAAGIAIVAPTSVPGSGEDPQRPGHDRREGPLGRAAIGVSVTYAEKTSSGWQGKQEIFFDPESYAYLGETRDDGEMVSARAAWGVVKKPGARPSTRKGLPV